MSLLIFFRSALLTALVSIAVNQSASAATFPTNKSTPKSETKKTKKNTIKKDRKAAATPKVKRERKVSEKSALKAKSKAAPIAGKKTSAKELNHAALNKLHTKKSSVSMFTVLFYGVLSISIAAFFFAVWLDCRPTIYPSGKVYGPHDYLQSSFATEISDLGRANMIKQAQGSQSINTLRQQPIPVTVTREPVNKLQNSRASKVG